MKKSIFVGAAVALLSSVSLASAGGWGFHQPDRSADIDVSAGAGAGTVQTGYGHTFAKVRESASGYANTSPRAQGEFRVEASTGGFGVARGGLEMLSGAAGGGSIEADASRRPTTASADFEADVVSVGVGDKVAGVQGIKGVASASAVDTPRYDTANASAGALAQQAMSAQSHGKHEAVASVATSISVSVDAATDDGRR